MNYIIGRRIILSFAQDSDIEALLRWRNSESFLRFCTLKRNKVTLEEFKQELLEDLNHDRFCQMIIRKKFASNSIGTIYCYNLNRHDGYAFITIYIDDNSQRIGYGAEAFALFFCHIFKLIPELHKIYVEVYEYNTRSISCLVRAGFVEEGRFKEHKLFESKRYDLIRFAFFRRDLAKTRQRIKKLFGIDGENL